MRDVGLTNHAQDPARIAALTVLQVNTDNIGGGAAKVMRDLHHAYMDRGVDAWMAVGYRTGTDERVRLIDNDTERGAWKRALTRAAEAAEGPSRAQSGPLRRGAGLALRLLADTARYRDILAGIEDVAFPATSRLLELPPHTPDVLHLHNLHGYYFDLRELPRLTARVPAVLTMHDAWLLTGHCAHPFDCVRWREGCGDCPDLGLYVPIRRDASATNAALKRDVIARSDVRLASPSNWLLRMANESGILDSATEIRHIPNGVDTRIYAPGDRAAARASLGLPKDRPIVLVVAHLLEDNPFKDYPTLRAALPSIPVHDGQSPLVVALGSGSDETVDGADIMPVAYVSDPAQVALYYRAADVYAHAARAENQPLAVLEAMACGTPVVASAVGGIPEIVADGRTGLLVPPGDPTALAAAIGELLGNARLRQACGEAGASDVRAHHTLDRQADAYVSWFEEILAARS